LNPALRWRMMQLSFESKSGSRGQGSGISSKSMPFIPARYN
jgi:hypothetical protein